MEVKVMPYNSVTLEDIEKLKSICDEERVYTGEAIHEDYSHDELHGLVSNPEVLVEAVSTEEVSEIMAYAWSRNIPVTPRGQGTGLVGGAVCIDGGIMLSLQKMNKILELDNENLTLTVEPGVLLMEISAYVEPNGLLYPPDPGEKSATIGGNISTNAGGMRAVKYGVTRDYVLGIEVVLLAMDLTGFFRGMDRYSARWSLLMALSGFLVWCWMIVFIGFGNRFLKRGSSVLKYFSEAAR